MDKTTEFLKDVERVAKSFNVAGGQSLIIIASDEVNESQRKTIVSIKGKGLCVMNGLSDFIGDNKELMALAMVINKMETKKNNHGN